MQPGDDVVFLPDPLAAGIGEILHVLANGQLLVSFDEEQTPRPCDPHDLELLALFQAAA